jgi:hypothetical protein
MVPVRRWLENPFNQMIIGLFVPCPECGAEAGTYCQEERLAGQYVHAIRLEAGRLELRDGLGAG